MEFIKDAYKINDLLVLTTHKVQCRRLWVVGGRRPVVGGRRSAVGGRWSLFVTPYACAQRPHRPPTTATNLQVDRKQLLRQIVHVWALSLLNNNAVNADPHPGNLLFRLTPDGQAQPVLLDWGWVVRLQRHELLAYRSLVMALADMDMVAATKSLKDLGYENTQDDRAPERSVQFFSHLFRDTGSVATAKKRVEGILRAAQEAKGERRRAWGAREGRTEDEEDPR
mmetsp:Transcript_10028/g.26073  ORF Transcript_10028/g.26073 Transcript_10028/m.26073 type:complete len:225 (+) Transcript_10028:331-1005(+)